MLDADLITLFRWILEAASIAVLIATALWLKAQAGTIPERLPSHFGITGKPDKWGGRWVIWLLLVVQFGTYGVLSAGGQTLDLIAGVESRHPTSALAMTGTKLMCTAMMGYILWVTIRVGRGEAQRMNVLVLFTFIAAVAVPAIILGSK